MLFVANSGGRDGQWGAESAWVEAGRMASKSLPSGPGTFISLVHSPRCWGRAQPAISESYLFSTELDPPLGWTQVSYTLETDALNNEGITGLKMLEACMTNTGPFFSVGTSKREAKE